MPPRINATPQAAPAELPSGTAAQRCAALARVFEILAGAYDAAIVTPTPPSVPRVPTATTTEGDHE